MKPSVSVVTLGVGDFVRSFRFYKEGLGWPTRAKEDDPVAFFRLNGVVLALYPKDKLAEDAGVSAEGNGFGGITLAHNVESAQEVDDVLAAAEACGATVVKRGQAAFWGGYSGYFADPDGYLWEVVHNPGWALDEEGRVLL